MLTPMNLSFLSVSVCPYYDMNVLASFPSQYCWVWHRAAGWELSFTELLRAARLVADLRW